jgi:outer membrane protein assembly factor BamB
MHKCSGWFAVLVSLIGPSLVWADGPEDLWSAARKGDTPAVARLLDKGVDVNAPTSYGATALWFAAMNGRTDTVKLLLAHHAATNLRDRIWNSDALSVAAEFEHLEAIESLLRAGAGGGDALVLSAVTSGNVKLLRTVLKAAKVEPEVLSAALLLAPSNNAEVRKLLTEASARPFAKPFGDPTRLRDFEGDYEEDRGLRVRLHVKDGWLVEQFNGRDTYVLKSVGNLRFMPIGQPTESFILERLGDRIVGFTYRRGPLETLYRRGQTQEATVAGKQQAEQPEPPRVRCNWPSFRGRQASGIADGQHLPVSWDVATRRNVLWKADLPGLAHSSPIVWEGKVFITTAVSSDPKSEFRFGLFGAGSSAKDESRHQWRVYCLDAATGKVLWDRTAHAGVPRLKRHTKSTQANPTPATDGKHLVVSFASEGLYCYDVEGKFRWKADLGLIDDGAFNAPELQWGAASSPILYRNLVLVQCDRQKDSFLTAYDLESGQRAWYTPRDEIPSWGTPTVYESPTRPEVILNATHHICGYDPGTGKELWRLAPNSQITTPTPVVGAGLIFVTSGYSPVQPIYAIRPGASGDISLAPGEESSTYLAWSKKRGGPYTPTPLVYDRYLYTCSNIGIVTCYDARTGRELYRQRLGGSGGYSASPVAADGKLYFASEAGEVRVVKAGPAFALLAVNKMDDPCLATPAIADGRLFVRSQHHLFALGWPAVTRPVYAQAPSR